MPAFNPTAGSAEQTGRLWIVLIWLALGVIILAWMRISGNEAWLSKAAEIIAEREETAAEEARGGRSERIR